MNTEISAGGIIVTPSGSGWKVLLMKDMKGNWTFPKGKVEKGETLVQTALREIQEEVGIAGLSLIGELTPTMYWYFREKSIKKTVHYFLFQIASAKKLVVQTEEGISDAKWMTWEQAVLRLGYPKTNLPLISQAEKLLEALPARKK